MAKSVLEPIEFFFEQWDPVLERMGELAASGKGWVNLLPEIVEDESTPRARSGLAGIFRSSGPFVPMGTWLAPTAKEAATVGVEHGVRQKVVARLHDAGIPIPAGWRLLQDNVRRGLVVRLPVDGSAQPADVLGWLMEVIDELCPATITGHWLAEVHPG